MVSTRWDCLLLLCLCRSFFIETELLFVYNIQIRDSITTWIECSSTMEKNYSHRHPEAKTFSVQVAHSLSFRILKFSYGTLNK